MPPSGKLMPNHVPNCWWQVIAVDMIMELPQSHGYDAIMVVVNCLSKWAHIIPTVSDITASRVASLFRDHMWKLHGLPEEVTSDRGTQFVLSFTHILRQFLGICVAASTTYHPQAKIQMEQVN